MGLQSAMTTALTGMQAAETSLDVIGNNIANSNTVGFKSSEVIFSTQFLQTESIGSAPTTGSGGTNPRQTGLGVQVAEISPDFSQGTIEISSNPLDMAIQGDGFLIVQGGQGEPLYTRNGQMSLNSLNEIVSSSGNRLLGYGINGSGDIVDSTLVPLEIPLGEERVAQATSEVQLAGVLNPGVDVGTDQETLNSQVFGDGSVEFVDDAGFSTATSVAVTSSPAPGAATAGAGASTDLVGDYSYRVVYHDPTATAGADQTTASPSWSVTGVPSGAGIDLTGLPGSALGEFSEYTLYRTTSGGSTFYEVGSFTANAANQTLTDTLSDAAIVGNPTLENSAVGNGSYNYYVTYYDPASQTETRPSEPLSSVAVPDNESSVRIDLSNVSLPADSNFTELRIYRNAEGDTSRYYLLDEIDVPLAGSLSAYVDTTSSADLVANSTKELDRDGPVAGPGTRLVDVQLRTGTDYSTPFQVGALSFQGERAGGELSEKTLQVTATTTVQDYLDFIEDALGLQDTSNVVDDPLPDGGGDVTISAGVVSIVSNHGVQNAIDIPSTAFKITPTGSTTTQPVTINFSQVAPPANGPGTTTEMVIYDSLGTPMTVRVTTVRELSDNPSTSTVYRWYATSPDNQPLSGDSTAVGNGTLIFDSEGNLVTSPNARINIFREGSAAESPVEVDLDFSSVNALVETDASGELTSNLNATSQDGFPPGVLTDFSITDSGQILGQYSNGTQRTLGQVAMAGFSNNNGLVQLGDSLFAASVNSGEPVIGEPGQNGIGAITAGAVELSNTDIGQDLVEMILAQTQYSSGSRVISAAQELLDELLSLQR